MRKRHDLTGSFLLVLCVSCVLVRDASASDWSHWRGAEQTGVSRETDLPEKFSSDKGGENLVWKVPYGGRTTPIVQNGRAYLINLSGDGPTTQERVMCFDADTGKLLWQHKFNVFLTDIVADRVGWTVLCGDPETGNVYAHGVQGMLFCFDKDGKVIWSRSLTEEYGRISGYGGRVTSPIVDGNLLLLGLVNASWGEQGRGGNRFVAFDKKTGEVVWWSQTPGQVKDTYYSTPVVAVINGQRLMISGGADGGVHAFKVRTGEHVWSYFFGTAAVNCSPVVSGNYVFIGHGEENPDNTQLGRVVCLDASKIENNKPALVWQKDGLKIKFASPIIHGGRLYVCDENARMYCLDAKDGKQLWRVAYGRNCKGSPVLGDGKIYVGEVNSIFHILKPGDKKCEKLYAQEFLPAPGSIADVEINGSPAVANGKVYFMTSEELYCIGKKDHKAAADKSPTMPEEAPAGKAAVLQIVPADAVVSPGGKQTFTARLFDANGRFLREVKPDWSLAPMLPPPPLPGAPVPPKTGAAPPPPPPAPKGEISAAGELSVDMTPGQFGNVMAKAEGLTGRARLRVAPRLPIAQDFEKVPVERTPAGWVNTQGKFAVQEKGGSKVLVKLATNASPLVARAYAYMGVPTLTNYTVESDVMGSKVNADMPDAGVVANRYVLLLDGTKQRLRLTSWDALPRVDKTLAFSWKPDVWYRMKLRINQENGKAVARGKVWERGQKEPDEWTVEVVDDTPNTEGSPALYGYATGILTGQKGCEIFYDNVVVTPNNK